MNRKSKYRSKLFTAKGLGSGGSGTHHWWHQRVTAIALIPITLWLVWFCGQIFGKEASEIIATIAKPYNLVGLILFIIVMFYHAALGMQVVIEDYVTCRIMRLFMLLTIQIFSVVTVMSLIVAFLYVMTL